ncbi:hypothetical protein BHM03_00027638 [Ensete ventricosum]|nr:hypothetical protein BHM03_00027638 [Ensete ventricosum]
MILPEGWIFPQLKSLNRQAAGDGLAITIPIHRPRLGVSDAFLKPDPAANAPRGIRVSRSLLGLRSLDLVGILLPLSRMRERRRSSGKMDPSDESEAAPSIVVLSSSDDEEANEDLSLAIVKKARHREAKRKWSEDALGPGPATAVSPAHVIEISSSSSEAELASDPTPAPSAGGLMSPMEETKDMEKKPKKKRRRKKKKQLEEKEVVSFMLSEKGDSSGEYYYSRRREAIGAARVCDH